MKIAVSQRLGHSLILGLTTVLTAAFPARSAERIQFFFGPFEPTIYVEDLAQLVEDGTISDRFRPVADRLGEEQLVNVRSLLSTTFEIDSVMISQFTYGPVGERLLQQAGQVVRTDNMLSGSRALRAALIFAAAEEDGLTILNIIQQFPLETIQIDFALLSQIIAENQSIFQLRDEVVAGVREISVEQAAEQAIALPDAGAPHLPGPYSWQQETLTFQNPGRPEASLADLYLPDVASPPAGGIPLVVISHGIASDRATFSYLGTHLASHGYAVALVEHAETTAEKFGRFLQGLEGPPNPTELLHRPRDITAILDELAQLAETRSDLQQLNLQTVGVLGQSLGGYTVLAAAGAELDRENLRQECEITLERPSVNLSQLIQCQILQLPEDVSLAVQDQRVIAAVALNPVTSSLFGENGLAQMQQPVMVVGSTDDYFAPIVPEQIIPFTWFEHLESYLVIVESGTHFSFLGNSEGGTLPVPETLIGPEPELSRAQIQGLSLAFFNRFLLAQTEQEAYLSQTYMDTLDQVPFRFNIIQNFFE
ncbi:MAG: alpha/beta hydrolase [Cyanobacteria bacterium P01_A01_bin.123]